MTDTPIRVLVVDSHQTYAELLGFALDGQPRLDCVGHAANVAQALQLVGKLRPDVVLLDVDLPDGDGIAVTERLLAQHPHIRVVMLTASTDPAIVGRATAAGASGLLTKDGALGDVLHAVHTAYKGRMTVSTQLLTNLLRSTPPPASGGGLTAREHQVLQLVGVGMDARKIARQLGISVHTCRGYVKSVLAKLDVHSQLEAVVVATRRGLLSPTEQD